MADHRPGVHASSDRWEVEVGVEVRGDPRQPGEGRRRRDRAAQHGVADVLDDGVVGAGLCDGDVEQCDGKLSRP